MLMELAEDSRAPFPSSRFPASTAANTFFTPVWASSKLPLMPQEQTLPPSWVTIWAFCTADTPFSGKNTMIFVPGTSWKPSRAALPVSPEVAVRITISSSMSSMPRALVMSCGSMESATSLNADVGPRNSSST